MTSIFTNNPIKVNVMSIIERRILKKYVFIGVVPKNVEQELKKIQNLKTFSQKNSTLKKFYGDSWSKLLGVDFLIKKKGGDEFDFDEEEEVQHKKKVKEAQISEEEIEKIMSEENDLGSSVDPILDNIFQQSYPAAKKVEESKDTQLIFIFDDPFVSIYPYDKISEFKKKIFIASKIPMYRQHIWITSKSASLPMSYNMSIGNTPTPVNIQKLSEMYTDGKLDPTEKQMGNIPINMNTYNMSERIKIEAYDNFKIMEEYYTKYGITEFNLADIKEFISPENRNFSEGVLQNKQQFNLLYYGFVMLYWPMITIVTFRDYLKGESNIQNYYPELYPNYEKQKEMYASEKSILDNSQDLMQNSSRKKELELVTKKIISSITSATINVVYISNLKEKVIFPRNLFDKFDLDDTIDACRCVTNHEDKSFILDKTYKGSQAIKEMISTEGIIFRIKSKYEDLSKNIIIIFYRNGNYIIKSHWRDEYYYDFDAIYKEVKKITIPLIDKINSFASFVLQEGKKVAHMSRYNSKFVEIGLNVYYKQVFTESQFALLKYIMEEYKDAGIMNGRNVEKNFAEYYFRKGMYRFDPRRIDKISNIRNYYDYMSDGVIKQKWFTVFEKTRITKIWYRFSDIKIEIHGIREEEFNIFYNIIISIFNMFENRKEKNVKDYEFRKLTKKKVKKTLTNLKEQDPVLYDFKKIYKSNKVYSRICQKTYQPLLLNKESYDKLNQEQKKNVVKYWNFTSETDAYYQCPNPKYPYIKFITKNHPKDYCIPCCKKISISDEPEDPKRIIHDICIKDHKYTKPKKTITTGSKYIMSYGKDIEIGRLSKLPENSMEGIFYETFSMENETDPAYMTSDGFYLYGINQHTSSINDVGYIYSLAHAMDVNIYDLTKMLIEKIQSKKYVFNILLKGKITKYISDVNTLIEYINKGFGDPKSGDFLSDKYEIPWNKLFIDLAFNYLDINTILFQHKRDAEDIDLRLPNGLEDVNDYILKKKKNIIILQKGNIYNPVYLINTELFFKLGIIEKKIFQFHDGIIRIIKGIVQKYIKTIQIKGKTYSKVNLIVIKEFLKDTKMSKKFSIHRLFINHSNFCYGLQLYNSSNKKYIYIPIEQSYYSFNISPNLEFSPFSRSHKKYKQSFKDLMSFINEFNRWVDIQSVKAQIKKESDLFSKIKVEAWLVLQKSLDFKNTDKVIGFKSCNLYYYFNDMPHSEAIKLRKVKSIPLLYDPDIINKTIDKRECPKPDKRTDQLAQNLYKYNIYQLFLLEFLKILRKTKNLTLRNKIKKLFLGDFTKQMNKVNNTLIEIIESAEDLLKIRMQVSDYINNHHDRKQLYLDIDNTSYQFDTILMQKLTQKTKPVLINDLKRMSKGFVKFGDVRKIKNFNFTNMFASCQDQKNENYCMNKKLIITKEKFEEFIEILASDILNPIKQKWIFSTIMSDRVINFLQFINRPNEEISITPIDLN